MKIVNKDLLRSFSATCVCEWCGKWFPQGVDPAHIFSRGAGQLDIEINLCAMCRFCHGDSHQKQEPSTLCLMIVAGHRECMLVDDIQEEVWRLRRECGK